MTLALTSFIIDMASFLSFNRFRGIRLRDVELYSSKFKRLFTCIKGGKEISFNKINDDFCDCPEDGSDEPGTNACPNGVFYCKFQHRHVTGRGAYDMIPSSRVNDGICDCCDGSDEYLSKQLIVVTVVTRF